MKPVRRLGLLDLMILIAATGPAIYLFQQFDRASPALTYIASTEMAPSKIRPWFLSYGLVPGFSVLTLSLLPIRWLETRPRPRRAVRAPGTIPGLVAAFAFGVVAARVALDWPAIRQTHFAFVGLVTPVGLLSLRLVGTKDLVGPAVAFSWILLAIGGGWRPEANWVDRTGRAVGVIWIVLGMVSWVLGMNR